MTILIGKSLSALIRHAIACKHSHPLQYLVCDPTFTAQRPDPRAALPMDSPTPHGRNSDGTGRRGTIPQATRVRHAKSLNSFSEEHTIWFRHLIPTSRPSWPTSIA